MAIDEALAMLAPSTGFSPTLRIYQWSRPAVTIGRNQEAGGGIDLEFCREHAIDIVRRPTGGRAVYHHRELTYTVVVPRTFFKKDTVKESYRVLAQGFLECLAVLGVRGELITPQVRRKTRRLTGKEGLLHKEGLLRKKRKSDRPACFLAPSWYEIGVGGRKIIGSAQRRYRTSILQQGSILLAIDWERFLRVFQGQEKQGRSQITDIEEVSGKKVGYEKVAGALIEGFKKTFGVRMAEGRLSQQERDLAQQLAEKKYGCADWNINRVNSFQPPIREN